MRPQDKRPKTIHRTGARLEHRALRGSSVAGIGFFLTLAQSVAQVPLFISSLGSEQYGAWLSALALASMITIIDASFQAYVGNIVQQEDSKSKASSERLLGSALKFSMLHAGVMISLILFLNLVYRSFNKSLNGTAILDSATLILLQYYVSATFVGIHVKLYAPRGRFATHAIWYHSARLLQFLACVASVSYFNTLNALVLTYSATGVIGSLLQEYDCGRRYGSIIRLARQGTLREGVKLWARSVGLSGSFLLDQVAQNGIVLMLTTWANLTAVSQFGTLRTVCNTAAAAISALHAPVLPDLARLYSLGEGQKLGDVIQGLYYIQGWLLFIGALLTAAPFEYLYGLWTRGHLPLDQGLLFSMIVAVVLRSSSAPLTSFYYANNAIGPQVGMAGLRAVVPFIIFLIVGQNIELWHLGIAVVISEGLASNLYCWRVWREYERQIQIPERLLRWQALEALQASTIALIIGGVLLAPHIAFAFSFIGAALIAVIQQKRWVLIGSDAKLRIIALIPTRLSQRENLQSPN
jgi:O-antigen/teichoic acid export membrane protein